MLEHIKIPELRKLTKSWLKLSQLQIILKKGLSKKKTMSSLNVKSETMNFRDYGYLNEKQLLR